MSQIQIRTLLNFRVLGIFIREFIFIAGNFYQQFCAFYFQCLILHVVILSKTSINKYSKKFYVVQFALPFWVSVTKFHTAIYY
jgi:hypothetical protein